MSEANSQTSSAEAASNMAAIAHADSKFTNDFELDQILYCSLLSAPMTQSAIEQLVASAASLNRMDHITGMLMYADGVFIQLIEGPRLAVNHLWARILQDQRHMGIVQLYHRREVESRVCEGWGMQLVNRQTVQAMIHEAHTEIVNGRKTAWAPAIERMDELLSHSDWRVMVRELQTGGRAT
jgi:Sensors of blue-light using FAD